MKCENDEILKILKLEKKVREKLGKTFEAVGSETHRKAQKDRDDVLDDMIELFKYAPVEDLKTVRAMAESAKAVIEASEHFYEENDI